MMITIVILTTIINSTTIFLQPMSPDETVDVPRILINRIEIVVVDKTNPQKPVSMTVEVWGCFETEC